MRGMRIWSDRSVTCFQFIRTADLYRRLVAALRACCRFVAVTEALATTIHLDVKAPFATAVSSGGRRSEQGLTQPMLERMLEAVPAAAGGAGSRLGLGPMKDVARWSRAHPDSASPAHKDGGLGMICSPEPYLCQPKYSIGGGGGGLALGSA